MLLGVTYGGDGDDRYQIELMAEQLDCDPSQWVSREARLRAMTRMLIRRHRDRIERVADALLVKRKLSAKQIDKLAGRSINDLGLPLSSSKRLSRAALRYQRWRCSRK
jgi:hypothetical protein